MQEAKAYNFTSLLSENLFSSIRKHPNGPNQICKIHDIHYNDEGVRKTALTKLYIFLTQTKALWLQ